MPTSIKAAPSEDDSAGGIPGIEITPNRGTHLLAPGGDTWGTYAWFGLALSFGFKFTGRGLTVPLELDARLRGESRIVVGNSKALAEIH